MSAEAFSALEALYGAAREAVRARVTKDGKVQGDLLDREQLAAHALAYLCTEIQAARQLVAWAAQPDASAYDRLVAETYLAELVRSLRGGVDLGQTEVIPLSEMGISEKTLLATIGAPALATWADECTSASHYMDIANGVKERGAGRFGLTDDTLVATQKEFRAFVDREVKPIAQDIHRQDKLVPKELVAKLAALGVFGLTIPEEYGGAGATKLAMCVVTEELSRGYIGVGSLATRTEIAGELVLLNGTEAQKKELLPKIASGEVMPTAVFTEPNHGSDLAHVQTRGVRNGDEWHIHGQKIWITHAVRANLMTLLARTKPDDSGYGGLSMFLPRRRVGKTARRRSSSTRA